jgi:HAE1 family hydrophobic/amphiphilic exporter-1
MRYNQYRCAQFNATAAEGYTTPEAMAALEEVFRQTMPREMGYDYLGMSYQEKKAQEGISSFAIFGFSLLCVCLLLAAQYESWALPLPCSSLAVAAWRVRALVLRQGTTSSPDRLVMRIGLAARMPSSSRNSPNGVRQGRPSPRRPAAQLRLTHSS